MEPENQDSAPPELPPRASRKLNLNEALAKTISSELNSRLSTIRTSGSAATPSRISGVQFDANNPPPMPPRRGNDVKVSDENLEDYDIPEEDEAPPVPPRENADAPPAVPPRGENVRMSDENLEDFDLPDADGPPPPVPPRGADVKMSDENLEDFDLPEEAPPALPPRRDEEEEASQAPPPIPARTYHHIEEDEEESKPSKEVSNDDSSEEIKNLQQEIEDLKQELQDKNEVISDLKTDYNRLCGEIKSLKENNRSNEDKIKQLKKENETLKSQNDTLKAQNDQLKKDNDDLKQKNSQLKIDTSRPTSPTKSLKSSTSPSKPSPAIPPKPSRKVCESMIQSAKAITNEEYDLGGDSTTAEPAPIPEEHEESGKDNSNNSSVSSSVEFLPGTSSRPLVLPTKSCVRKRGNRLSSAITERKSSKKVTSTLTDEPLSLDIDSPTSATTPLDMERRNTVDSMMSTTSTSSKPQTPVIPPKPQLPPRSSERKASAAATSIDEEREREREGEEEEERRRPSIPPELPRKKPSLASSGIAVHEEPESEKEEENDDKEGRATSPIKEDHDEEEEEKRSPTTPKEGGEGEGEAEAEPEPEINPTLSRIHKIGRGLPSMLPEGGLSSVKLRSRREDSHSGRQLEHLNEEQLKQWIFTTVQKDPVEGDLFAILHDGQLLCELINVIRSPDHQITPKKGKMRPWHIVNINAYLSGCVDLRLKTLFKAEDLYEGEGLDKIMDNLSELKFYADTKK